MERLITEARDPPVLILKGPNNSVKCYRYRLLHTHGDYFTYVSSTFKWVNKEEKGNSGRLLIAFKDVQQRDRFLSTVTMPKQITWYYGKLDGL